MEPALSTNVTVGAFDILAKINEVVNSIADATSVLNFIGDDGDISKLLVTLAGLGLIVFSHRLSKSSTYYYFFTAFVLSVALIFLYGFTQSRRVGVIQFTLTTVITSIWSDAIGNYLLMVYLTLVLISLLVLWWWGPPENPRTPTVFKLFTTVIGIMWVSQQSINPWTWIRNSYDEGTFHGQTRFVFALTLATVQNLLMPEDWIMTLANFFAMMLPWNIILYVPRKLKMKWIILNMTSRTYLTEEEYRRQTIIATRKETLALQENVRSMDSPKLIKTLARLNDPKLFIQYLDSGDHVSTEQQTSWEREEDFDSFIESNEDQSDSEDSSETEISSKKHASPTPFRQAEQLRNRKHVHVEPKIVTSAAPRPQPSKRRSRYDSPKTSKIDKRNVARSSTSSQHTVFYSQATLNRMDDAGIAMAMRELGLPVRPVNPTSRPFLIKRILKHQLS